jgi:hypothetical protein
MRMTAFLNSMNFLEENFKNTFHFNTNLLNFTMLPVNHSEIHYRLVYFNILKKHFSVNVLKKFHYFRLKTKMNTIY